MTAVSLDTLAPLLIVVVTGLLYLRGRPDPRAAASTYRRAEPGWREPAFWAGLTVVLIALDQPMDAAADSFLWAHMLQHVLLTGAAAPLLVLGAPWMRIWRGLPLRLRRRVARALAHRRAGPLRATARGIAAPVVAAVLFNADFLVWHLPRLYDAALASRAIHDAEHLSFLLFAMLFWAQVVDSPPLRRPLTGFAPIAYLLSAAFVGWVLALTLTMAVAPIYPHYAAAAARRGVSAIADQELAGGIMWIPAEIPYIIGVFYFIARWLGEDERAHQAPGGSDSGGGPGVRLDGAPGPQPPVWPHRPAPERETAHV